MSTLDDVQALESKHVLTTYKRQPVVFVRGEGVRLFDTEGKAYLDLLSGIGVAARGHGDPELTKAIAEQAATLMHVSNLYYHPLQGEAARLLTQLSGLSRVLRSGVPRAELDLHVRNALHGPTGPGLREAADDWNAAHGVHR